MVHASQYPTVSTAERRWVFLATTIVLLITTIPYVVCWFSAGPDMVFTGILLNPSDGFSYLAKMRMGWEGNWVFHLPFTTEGGPGAYINLYYLALGHLAHFFSLPLPLVYHIARILGGFVLLWLIYRLIAHVADTIGLRKLLWWLVALSSGLGWIVQKYGFGYSYYIHETILVSNTFYCLILNAHFPIAMAIMLAMFVQALKTHSYSLYNIIQFCFLSLLLAIILPFSVVATYLVLGATLVAIWFRDRLFPRFQFVITLIGGLMTVPVLLYMHFATQADPILRQWSLQNKTPSPSILVLLISYGLLIVFLIPGIKLAWRRKSDWDILLMTWIIVIFIAMYVPYSLQFRFTLGMHIPIAILAALGLAETLRSLWARRIVMALMATTSVYIIINLLGRSPVNIAVTHFQSIYVSKHESAAYNWLQANVPYNKTVLGAQPTGLFIPAFAGQKVISGHVFETPEAPRKQKLVNDFFLGDVDGSKVLREYAIDYVLIGPRERKLGEIDPTLLPLRKVFTSGDVSVFKVEFTH